MTRSPPTTPPIRPCPRTVAIENAAFLRELRRTGSVRIAARAIGRPESTVRRRRKRLPAFDAAWRAALVVAAARLQATLDGRATGVWKEAPPAAWRTRGGEPVIAPRRGGGLQQRAAKSNSLTRGCEQAFLLALSVTANVGLAAKAAGASKYAIYRRRSLDPGFAREWRMALQQGYETLELRCLAAVDPDAHEHDGWRHNEPPEMPPMSFNQMLQLLYLHQKEARLLAEPAHLKQRRGESRAAYDYRLTAMGEERRRRAREQFRVAEAARAARGEPTYFEGEGIGLPDLAQVAAGRGDPAATPHDPETALFGGWRIEEMKARQRGGPKR